MDECMHAYTLPPVCKFIQVIEVVVEEKDIHSPSMSLSLLLRFTQSSRVVKNLRLISFDT